MEKLSNSEVACKIRMTSTENASLDVKTQRKQLCEFYTLF
jgi:hypothetical protein